MISGIRAIYIMTELEGPPIAERAMKPTQARKLYNALVGSGHSYDNLDLQTNPCSLNTRREDGQSSCLIWKHSIRIVEEKPELPLGEFDKIARTVFTTLKESCDLPPVFYLQRTRIQCVCQPNSQETLDLLAGKVANVLGAIEPFGRPPGLFGIRFRFPPFHPDDMKGTEEEPDEDQPTSGVPDEDEDDFPFKEEAHGFVTVRIEMYEEDPNLIMIEVSCSHLFKDQISLDNLDEVCKNIQQADSFLRDKCKAFLDQFDTKDEENES